MPASYSIEILYDEHAHPDDHLSFQTANGTFASFNPPPVDGPNNWSTLHKLTSLANLSGSVAGVSQEAVDHSDSLRNINVVAYNIVLPVICACGIVGNILNLLTLRSRLLQSVSYMYVRALAVADMGCMLFILLFIVQLGKLLPGSDFTRSVYGAHLQLPLINFFIAAGVLTIVALTVERYISVVWPVSFRSWNTARRAKTIITMAYATSALMYIPMCFKKHVVFMYDKDCIQNTTMPTTVAVSLFTTVSEPNQTRPGDDECPGYFTYKENPDWADHTLFAVYKWTREVMLRLIPIIILAYMNIHIILRLKVIQKRRQRMLGKRQTSTNDESLLNLHQPPPPKLSVQPGSKNRTKEIKAPVKRTLSAETRSAPTRQSQNSTAPSGGGKANTEKDRLLVLLAGIVVLFFVCNIPAAINLVFINDNLRHNVNFQLFRATANLLEIANHAVNFYIFCMCSKDYRKVFLKRFIISLKCLPSPPTDTRSYHNLAQSPQTAGVGSRARRLRQLFPTIPQRRTIVVKPENLALAANRNCAPSTQPPLTANSQYGETPKNCNDSSQNLTNQTPQFDLSLQIDGPPNGGGGPKTAIAGLNPTSATTIQQAGCNTCYDSIALPDSRRYSLFSREQASHHHKRLAGSHFRADQDSVNNVYSMPSLGNDDCEDEKINLIHQRRHRSKSHNKIHQSVSSDSCNLLPNASEFKHHHRYHTENSKALTPTGRPSLTGNIVLPTKCPFTEFAISQHRTHSQYANKMENISCSELNGKHGLDKNEWPVRHENNSTPNIASATQVVQNEHFEPPQAHSCYNIFQTDHLEFSDHHSKSGSSPFINSAATASSLMNSTTSNYTKNTTEQTHQIIPSNNCEHQNSRLNPIGLNNLRSNHHLATCATLPRLNLTHLKNKKMESKRLFFESSAPSSAKSSADCDAIMGAGHTVWNNTDYRQHATPTSSIANDASLPSDPECGTSTMDTNMTRDSRKTHIPLEIVEQSLPCAPKVAPLPYCKYDESLAMMLEESFLGRRTSSDEFAVDDRDSGGLEDQFVTIPVEHRNNGEATLSNKSNGANNIQEMPDSYLNHDNSSDTDTEIYV